MAHMLLNRTSPMGERFVGTCAACGKSGITLQQMNDPCENQRNMTHEEALLEALNKEEIQGSVGKEVL